MKKLENKTVIITGGLSGIGWKCALEAAREGAAIAILDLETENTTDAMNELQTMSHQSTFIPCDVSDFKQVQTAFTKIKSVYGSIDVALNNAGIGGTSSNIGDMTEQNWHQVIAINLSGIFYCMKHELAQMMQQKSGVIVNVASILGKAGFPGSAHYVAAKHGVIGLTQTAALEYATKGIRVNSISPGFINTPLLTKGGILENNDALNHVIDLHPMKRLGLASEVAKSFIFLASDDSTFITGTDLGVDGGYLAQ
jgi:NAD(P)-dependent dehydrogenase (short-subunit alcohol dehydrogenase family)